MHETRFNIFVIHDQQALGRAAAVWVNAFDGEKVHAIMVAAHLLTLIGTGIL